MSCRNEEVFPACSQKPVAFYFSQYFPIFSFIVLLCLVLLWVQPRSGFRSQGGGRLDITSRCPRGISSKASVLSGCTGATGASAKQNPELIHVEAQLEIGLLI